MVSKKMVQVLSQKRFSELRSYLLLVFLLGVTVFLMKTNQKENLDFSKEISKNNTTSSSTLNWQDYIPVKIEYDAWAQKLGYFSNDEKNEEMSECNFMDYIFGQPISQTDPCLIQAFKEKFLLPPPPQDGESTRIQMNFDQELPSNVQKFRFIEKLLIEDSTDGPGFFIECGANDGLYISSTIRLEKVHNWSGLLIEAAEGPFSNLVHVKRNAYAVNAALCTSQKPEILQFFVNPEHTGWSSFVKNKDNKVTVTQSVQCIPFYTILKALELKTVDYLNLDVEGVELEVLKTLPFGTDLGDGEDEIIFKVITVEYKHIPGGLDALQEFLESKGYKWIANLKDRSTADALFVHSTLYEKARKIKI